jgi:hypothetical protein
MNMHKIITSVLPAEEINYLLELFDREPHFTTRSMEKAFLPLSDSVFVDFVTDIIKNKIGIVQPYKIVGDNFYKHSHSYFPHCDAIEDSAWLNIVVPLKLENSKQQQKFIVFDQTWSGKNATWMGSYNFNGDFASNKKILDRPCDGIYFNNSTGQQIPWELWQYVDQTYFTRDYFFGMSGTAYDWSPGNIIVFDSRHIHATGSMQASVKTGLSIRIAHL